MLDAFEALPVMAAVVGDDRGAALIRLGPGHWAALRGSTDPERYRLLLIPATTDDWLEWPGWSACLDDLTCISGATIDLVDVSKLANGRWRSLLLADVECCPPQGRPCLLG